MFLLPYYPANWALYRQHLNSAFVKDFQEQATCLLKPGSLVGSSIFIMTLVYSH